MELTDIQVRLRECIAESGIPQKEIARMVGVSPQTISKYMKKDIFPRAGHLCQAVPRAGRVERFYSGDTRVLTDGGRMKECGRAAYALRSVRDSCNGQRATALRESCESKRPSCAAQSCESNAALLCA